MTRFKQEEEVKKMRDKNQSCFNIKSRMAENT